MDLWRSVAALTVRRVSPHSDESVLKAGARLSITMWLSLAKSFDKSYFGGDCGVEQRSAHSRVRCGLTGLGG